MTSAIESDTRQMLAKNSVAPRGVSEQFGDNWIVSKWSKFRPVAKKPPKRVNAASYDAEFSIARSGT